jgi:carbon storage regulator CsrA
MIVEQTIAVAMARMLGRVNHRLARNRRSRPTRRPNVSNGTLVLTRKPGQVVRIGSLGTVRVVSVRGNVVRLGFDIDRTMRVDRDEVADRIEEQKAEAEARVPQAEPTRSYPLLPRSNGIMGDSRDYV